MLAKLRDLGPSVVRTLVPLVVQVLAAQIARHGIDPSPYSEVLAQVVGAVVAAVYYAGVRILETRGRQAWGWLLGLPRRPTYAPGMVFHLACWVCHEVLTFDEARAEAWGSVAVDSTAIGEVTLTSPVVAAHMKAHIDDGSWRKAMREHDERQAVTYRGRAARWVEGEA